MKKAKLKIKDKSALTKDSIKLLEALIELNQFTVQNVECEKIRVNPKAHLKAIKLIWKHRSY